MSDTWEELLAGSDAEWLEEEQNRLGGEISAAELEACYDELAAVIDGTQEALSEECQETLSREEDGSELVADTSVATFLSEWWWALGLVAAWLWLRTEEAGG